MTKPTSTTVKRQLQSFREAAEALVEAQQVHARARAAYDVARDRLEDRKRQLVAQSAPPGSRDRVAAETRDALIAGGLAGEAEALRQARELLREAESALEVARIHERTEREALRAVMALAV